MNRGRRLKAMTRALERIDFLLSSVERGKESDPAGTVADARTLLLGVMTRVDYEHQLHWHGEED